MIFEQDEGFNHFIAHQQLTRAKWALSQYAPYLPPNARKKARFHQLLTSADWAQRVLAQWSDLSPEVQTELSYIPHYEGLIRVLQMMQMVVDSFNKLVKSKGISPFSAACWQQGRQGLEADWQQQGWPVSEQVERFLGGLDAYLAESLSRVAEPNQILCCSDVIETGLAYQYVWEIQIWSWSAGNIW